jgi:adenylate cyclase
MGGARMTATGLACAACGTELPPNSKFCNECGAAVSAAAEPAEYKQVTVLFADVVHSMDIAAAVGAERWREIMAELVGRSARVVQRWGGVVDKFTGDGIMAVFGAPVALEDHAFRACSAALDIQEEAARLSAEIQRRDGVELRLRVGLNSGEVIAGDVGAGALGYTAIGEQVGMAQRMESVAPPGGVMLSTSTARLVEDAVELTEPELVRIKGAKEPVVACRLTAKTAQREHSRRNDPTLVGRGWELNTIAGILDEAIGGVGGVIGILGPPGIGKSRIVRESAALAGNRGVEVFTTYCESHTIDIPFHAVAGLLRAGLGVDDLDSEEARARIRARIPRADPEDLLLLDDLLGVADPDIELPDIEADARRRRLTALVNAASVARPEPALYLIEDAHWIDEVSESMLADFLAVIPHTHSMVLITYRPEYRGALATMPGAQTIALRPLSTAQSATLIGELLGTDSSVHGLVERIAERAAGNPFFAEEIVRDLAERGAIRGARGSYLLDGDGAEIRVPGHPAGRHRRPCRSPQPRRQTHAQRRVGHRITVQPRSNNRTGDRPGPRRADQGGTGRPGRVHPAGRVCVPASCDSHGGLRITAEVRSRRAAPAAGRRDRTTRAGFAGRERRPDRRTPRSGGRSACSVRLAHACRHLAHPPRHHRGAGELAARATRRRPDARRRNGSRRDADRSAHHALRERLPRGGQHGRHRV